jgi:hypothetical protein
MSKTHFLFLFLTCLHYIAANGNDTSQEGLENFNSEKKIQILKSFCNGKTENFCSPKSLYYMNLALKLDRDKELEKEREMNYLKSKQLMLSKFIANHPRYKFWIEMITDRNF